MGEKKHIDRIFQERFKDFEAAPSPMVWNNIEAKLNTKQKKRRIIPIWWQYAGVAATLLLAFTVGYQIMNTKGHKNPTIKISGAEQTKTQDTATITLENNKQRTTLNNTPSTVHINTHENTSVAPLKTHSKTSFKNNPNLNTISANQTTATNHHTSKATKLGYTVLAQQDTPKSVSENNLTSPKTETNSDSNLTPINSNVINNTINEKHSVAVSKANHLNKTNRPSTASGNEIETPRNTPLKDKQTIEDAIEQNNTIAKNETTKVAGLNKWRISPNAAPVYFNTLGQGSSLDAQFNSNPKRGEIHMSYGIQASYALNKRLTLRSGIHKVNLGYNTNDALVFSSLNANGVTQIPSALSSDIAPNTVAANRASSEGNSIVSAYTLKPSDVAAFEITNTTINQSFGFIEIPLELQYKLSAKRFGITVIGGFSTLFLDDYEATSVIKGQRKVLQGTNTINDKSYSANFGMGINYEVSKKINLNLEPTFKYQINTFKNATGNFQPFFIGVYTGFGFTF